MILEEATREVYGYYASELKPQSDKPILVTCDQCGKEKLTSKHDYHYLCMFCSLNYGEGQKGIIRTEEARINISASKTGVKHPLYGKRGINSIRWSGGPIKCICLICGKMFKIPSSVIKNGGGKYCSKNCFNKARRETLKGVNNPNWQGGISFEPYCVKFNNAFKEYIRAKFGYKCFLCPITQVENGKKLSVHHVNYNKQCECDGYKTCQFVPLCKSCHSKTGNNRDYWQKIITDKLHNTIIGWDV